MVHVLVVYTQFLSYKELYVALYLPRSQALLAKVSSESLGTRLALYKLLVLHVIIFVFEHIILNTDSEIYILS